MAEVSESSRPVGPDTRRAGRRSRAVLAGEIGRIRPTSVFERAGEGIDASICQDTRFKRPDTGLAGHGPDVHTSEASVDESERKALCVRRVGQLSVETPYGATTRPRLVERIAEAGSVAGRGCSPSPQDMPDALHVLVLPVAGWVNRPPEDQIAYLREEQRSLRASWPGGSVGPGACPWLAAAGRPVAACATIAGRLVPVGVWTRAAAHRRAVSGDRRPRSAAASPGCGGRVPSGPSHEAEGRGGARGGDAGRVGPPATRRRLCVLRQIGDELVAGVEQFLLVDDVVAVEDGAALVAGQEHGDPLGHAGADQVAGGGAPAIVEEAGRHPGRLTGGAPRRAPALLHEYPLRVGRRGPRAARLYEAKPIVADPLLRGIVDGASTYLYVRVGVVGRAFSTEVSFKKSLYDAVSDRHGFAATWDTGSDGTHGGDAGYILQFVSEGLDRFVLEYLCVNEAACG